MKQGAERLNSLIHPALTEEYALYTPPIAEFFENIATWIENRATGGYIFGASRLGKTKAIESWVEELIKERFNGKLPFFKMIYRNHDHITEREFLLELLLANHHKFKNAKNRIEIFERLVNYFCVRAKNAGGNQAILMIDEAQNAGESDYKWLCNIQNEMKERGYLLTIIFVGSHELTYQHEIFGLSQDAHLVGRFMTRFAKFRGINSIKELEFVLNGYDLYTEWPKDSKQSYTKYFFPRAFDAGFRLADLAPLLWEIYLNFAPLALQNNLEIPMEHIAKTIEYLFRNFSNKDDHLIDFSIDILKKAVDQTGFCNHMKALSSIMRKK